jgi:ABC-2 type transport system permease protein
MSIAASLERLEAPVPPSGLAPRLRWAASDAVVVTKRNLAHIRRVPEQLIDVTLQPVMLILLFAYVFASAIHLPGGGNYREYLVPGIFVQSIFFTAGRTAVNVSLDMTRGLNDRFLSLPMARSAFLLGRTVASLLENVLSLGIMAACGLVVGWRAHTGATHPVVAFVLLLGVSFAVSWVATFVGLVARGPEAATGLTMAILLPLTFIANTFVPTQGMPAAVRPVAEWNPISAAAAAARRLFGNPQPAPTHAHISWPLAHPVVATIAWSGVLLVIFSLLSVQRYRSATAR